MKLFLILFTEFQMTNFGNAPYIHGASICNHSKFTDHACADLQFVYKKKDSKYQVVYFPYSSWKGAVLFLCWGVRARRGDELIFAPITEPYQQSTRLPDQ